MGAPLAAAYKYNPARWADEFAARKLAGPDIPKPGAAPPPSDDVAAMIRALNKDATDRALRASKGRTAAFSLGRGSEPYRAPGSKPVLGV